MGELSRKRPGEREDAGPAEGVGEHASARSVENVGEHADARSATDVGEQADTRSVDNGSEHAGARSAENGGEHAHAHASERRAARSGARTTEQKGKARLAPETRDRLISLGSPILALVLWEAAVRAGMVDGRFFPAPSETAARFVELLSSGELWTAVKISLWRITAGFLAGAVPGVLVGLTMGLFPIIRATLQPAVAALYPIPKLALLPLIMLIFGIGELSKVITIAIGVFFPVLINTVAGVVGIDQIYLDVAKNFGARRSDFYLTIALPGALPMIWTGLKLGAGVALLLIVAAEMIAANAGIGYMIWTGYNTFDLEQMYVGFIIMAALGYVSSTLLDEFERWVIPWKQRKR